MVISILFMSASLYESDNQRVQAGEKAANGKNFDHDFAPIIRATLRPNARHARGPGVKGDRRECGALSVAKPFTLGFLIDVTYSSHDKMKGATVSGISLEFSPAGETSVSSAVVIGDPTIDDALQVLAFGRCGMFFALVR